MSPETLQEARDRLLREYDGRPAFNDKDRATIEHHFYLDRKKLPLQARARFGGHPIKALVKTLGIKQEEFSELCRYSRQTVFKGDWRATSWPVYEAVVVTAGALADAVYGAARGVKGPCPRRTSPYDAYGYGHPDEQGLLWAMKALSRCDPEPIFSYIPPEVPPSEEQKRRWREAWQHQDEKATQLEAMALLCELQDPAHIRAIRDYADALASIEGARESQVEPFEGSFSSNRESYRYEEYWNEDGSAVWRDELEEGEEERPDERTPLRNFFELLEVWRHNPNTGERDQARDQSLRFMKQFLIEQLRNM